MYNRQINNQSFFLSILSDFNLSIIHEIINQKNLILYIYNFNYNYFLTIIIDDVVIKYNSNARYC